MRGIGHQLQAVHGQFASPHGPLGHLVGVVMAIENRRAARLVVDLAKIRPTDRVLDVGCGPGVAVAFAAALALDGFAAGADPSAVMVRQARLTNRAAIRAGRVAITAAAAGELPFPSASFTRAITLNAIDHWPDTAKGLSELRRVLTSEGRLVIALRRHRGQEANADPHTKGATAQELEQLTAQIRNAGFPDVGRRDHDLGRETLAIFTATTIPTSPHSKEATA